MIESWNNLSLKKLQTFKDTEFVDKIIAIKDKAELINAFAEKGLELSMAEIDELAQEGKRLISSGEFDQIKKDIKDISDGELENISGGGKVKKFAQGLIDIPFGLIACLIEKPSTIKDPEAAGMLVGTTVLTLAATPTFYKGIKAAGKGVYNMGSKVYNKITNSKKTNNP